MKRMLLGISALGFLALACTTFGIPAALPAANPALSEILTPTGFAPGGATHEDLALMRANVSPHVQVKAAGGVRTLDALLAVRALGVSRSGATATQAILDDFRARKAGSAPAEARAVADRSAY